MAIKRQVQGLPRTAHRAVAAGAVGAATLSALLLPASLASAAPVTVPGVGSIDVPDQVLAQIPPGVVPPGIELPGIAPAPAPQQQTPGQRAADAAMTRVGTPYSYGATGPDAFDCSGLVQWSYEQAGVELPRTSQAQLSSGAPVSEDDLQPGDVVSFYGGSHSGLYVGDGNVVHASTYGQPVAVAPIASMPYAGARRY
ncbi:cell wall-associated NlpC family hydrolase [Nocardia transvalensis]|uniref:Cell wall-associated NlpC family hydrolase n=1 Tax=Nocardia transvalensis TaxID=37333 RepID=A0A7W9PL16_9NOCA|nr:C40 family peptidase [Nocardia transvalensis]MBB5918006.1 cell wall-associated NlpC family hydrolase [Nocardia transvalensis]